MDTLRPRSAYRPSGLQLSEVEVHALIVGAVGHHAIRLALRFGRRAAGVPHPLDRGRDVLDQPHRHAGGLPVTPGQHRHGYDVLHLPAFLDAARRKPPTQHLAVEGTGLRPRQVVERQQLRPGAVGGLLCAHRYPGLEAPPFRAGRNARSAGLSDPAERLRRVSRFRLSPTPAQETALLGHCAQARFGWNLALEQANSDGTAGRKASPNFAAQCRQLTEARAEHAWLAAGSQTVQQQARRDLDQAGRNFYGRTHRRPTWRKAGRHEGFRIVGGPAGRVRRLNRKWAEALVPKVGWVRFRLSRAIPDAKSYRVTRDSAGRWHIAFAAIPAESRVTR